MTFSQINNTLLSLFPPMRRLVAPSIFQANRRYASDTARKLENKVAIITGSTDGIGFAAARRMAQDGAKVVVSSRKQNNVDRAVAELEKLHPGQVAGLVCHVGKSQDRDRLIEYTLKKFGRINILVSNVAVNPYFGSLLEMEESHWDKIFDVNLKAPFMLTKSVVPHMLKNNREGDNGSIIYVSSIAAYAGMSGIGAYSISKTALLGLCKIASSEFAKEGVRVNLVAPGVIKTKFSGLLWESEGSDEFFKSMTHMKRLGEAEELGGVISFLASPDASYITGENVVVAGGYHCSM